MNASLAPTFGIDSRSDQFATAVRDHRSALLRFAVRIARGNRDMGADLLQDALLLSYRSFAAGRSDPLPYFRSWMYRIIQNVAHRSLEKESRYVCEENITGAVDSRMTAASPWESLDGQHIDARILAALDSLPESQRQCVILIDVHQFDYQETARELGIPAGTVRSRISRARARLFQLLADDMQSLLQA